MTQQTRAQDLGLKTIGNGNKGSYASRGHEESSANLGTKKWEENKLSEGSRTPWGRADQVTNYAPGIDRVDCPGHGGIKLSPQRNRAVPAYIRNSNGWYEEDCEFYIPSHFHFDDMVPSQRTGYNRDFDPAEWRKTVDEGLISWYPEVYEKETGIELLPGQSRTKDERTWNLQHQDDWKILSKKTVDGRAEVVIRRGEDKKTILMSEEKYSELESTPRTPMQPIGVTLVPDADSYEIAPPEVKAAKPRYTGFNMENVSDAKLGIVQRELSKQWKFPDGTVTDLEEILEKDGITGKWVQVKHGKRVYRLSYGDYGFEVSKALWDNVSAPDERTPSEKIWEQLNTLNIDSASYDWEKLKKLRQREKDLTEKYREALKAEREAKQPTS